MALAVSYGEYPVLTKAFYVIRYGVEPASRSILAVKILEKVGAMQFQSQPYRSPWANLLFICTTYGTRVRLLGAPIPGPPRGPT
jgi:hypothetical protein